MIELYYKLGYRVTIILSRYQPCYESKSNFQTCDLGYYIDKPNKPYYATKQTQFG